MNVPFYRPDIGEAEIAEVVDTLRSGWLTTGPKVKRFEESFAEAVDARVAIALNSATAALHLAVEALGLRQGEGVLVPTMTFAATAEVVRYLGAVPILVDCDPVTLNLDLADAESKLADLRDGRLPIPRDTAVVGIMPVHVGGWMCDLDAVGAFAKRHGLWVVEDSAHAFPAGWRANATDPLRAWGKSVSAVACYSFYANKTITTGEGGMAVADDPDVASRMRLMSLHGLSRDAWNRYSGGGWDYRIVAPGFKYNLTDVAAAIGIHQLARAEEMRRKREEWTHQYRARLSDVAEIELPLAEDEQHLHSWHLFPLKLRLDRLRIDRNAFIDELKSAGIGSSVHWRPLHLHTYYEDSFGWRREHLPVASEVWERLVTVPLFSTMTPAEHETVCRVVREICARHAR
jgi:dTDP-4-amino-4,6-dideoxygalactose transaminase